MLIPQLPKTLVMPLQNGTQKDVGLGPDFRRDDGKVQDDKEGKSSRGRRFTFDSSSVSLYYSATRASAP